MIGRTETPKARFNEHVARSLRRVRRLVVAVTGFTVLAVGVAMIVLPGPALAVIPLGLGILATEFVWARSLLDRVRNRLQRKGGKADETE